MQAYVDAAHLAGGGVVDLPEGTIVAEVVMKHRVSLHGQGMNRTILTGRPGSTTEAIITFAAGYVQNAFIRNLQVRGGGTDKQAGIVPNARAAGPDRDGGWWEGGMENVVVSGLAGVSDCIRFDAEASTGNLLPHQFLNFKHVVCFRNNVPGSTALTITAGTQAGQMHWDSCQLDGLDTTNRTSTNGRILSGYSITFTNCTTQNALTGFEIGGVIGLSLVGGVLREPRTLCRRQGRRALSRAH